jgi:hypothetical protein
MASTTIEPGRLPIRVLKEAVDGCLSLATSASSLFTQRIWGQRAGIVDFCCIVINARLYDYRLLFVSEPLSRMFVLLQERLELSNYI